MYGKPTYLTFFLIDSATHLSIIMHGHPIFPPYYPKPPLIMMFSLVTVRVQSHVPFVIYLLITHTPNTPNRPARNAMVTVYDVKSLGSWA